MTQSFLCTNCRKAMCTDCRQIAEEYQELLKIRTDALSIAEFTVGELQSQLLRQKIRADMWEHIARQGVPAVILAWMDQEINQLLAVGEDSKPSSPA